MLELGTLKIGITVDDKNVKPALQGVENQISSTSNKTSKLGGVAKKVGKVAAAGAVAAATALVAVSKKALDAYASYEQLKGGVEKLFGDSAQTIMNYANQAYKTAGISANQYMEQATSFSASLISSLNGDTQRAAKTTNMAIMDMSDNANVFGTNIADIQRAYQGFAKQNYTMLDNLKLGYGGTKTEMERLLADAEKISGIKYDINNLDDVYNAIHVIQQEMNITGTTAKEAAQTIEGSVNMTKAAWENLLAGLANENANMETLINNFVDSLVTASGNIIPRIGQILKNIPQALSGIVKGIMPQLVSMIQSTLPSLITSVVAMLTSMISTIVQVLPALFQSVISVLPTLIVQVINALAQLLPQIIALIPQLINMLVQALPQIIQALVASLPNLIVSLVTSIISYAPQIAIGLIKGAVMAVGQLIAAIPKLIANVATCLGANIKQLWTSVKNWIATGEWEFEPVQIDFETGETQDVTNTGKELTNANYGDATVGFDADTTQFENGVDEVQTETQELDGSKSITQIEADTESALKNIEGIKKVEEALPKNFKHTITIGTEGVQGAVKKLNSFVKQYNTVSNKVKKKLKVSITANVNSAVNNLKKVYQAYLPLTKMKHIVVKVSGSGFANVISNMKSVRSNWNKILDMKSNKTFTVTYKQKGNKPSGHRVGLREVPYDGYISELHKGETVLTAAETNQYKNYINGVNTTQTSGVTAEEIVRALSRANMTVVTQVDGRTLAQTTAPFMSEEINRIDYRANRKLGYV